ncbi:MAG: hypothetical protein JW884_09705 [Deltaproteobacteria bacterium]|nr:hypothetical protein [Deltaproteobacteria bacterium]
MERLAATGQTTARLAHYIKNILAGLRGGTYILNIGLDKSDVVKIRAGWDVSSGTLTGYPLWFRTSYPIQRNGNRTFRVDCPTRWTKISASLWKTMLEKKWPSSGSSIHRLVKC